MLFCESDMEGFDCTRHERDRPSLVVPLSTGMGRGTTGVFLINPFYQ